MALEFNSIGVKVKYCVSSSGTTRPTSSYTEIPDIKSIGDIAMQPNQIEVSNLVDQYKRYIPGLKDVGSDIQLTCNLTNALKTAWAACVTAAEAAWASDKSTWFEIAIPNFDSFYFAGLPTEMGISGINVDSVVEAQLHIIPNQIAGWATAST